MPSIRLTNPSNPAVVVISSPPSLNLFLLFLIRDLEFLNRYIDFNEI